MKNDAIIQLENKFYIATNSSYADHRILILNDSDTFGVFDRWGDILRFGEEVQGIYHEGTRFLSESEFRINGLRPTLLSSTVKEENDVLSVDLTTEAMTTINNELIAKGTLHISRNKFIINGACYEKISFTNYGSSVCEFQASLSFISDFRDIFEVRGVTRTKRGEIFEHTHGPDNIVQIRYRGIDEIIRTTFIQLSRTPDSWEGSDTAIFQFCIAPHDTVEFEYHILFGVAVIPQKSISFREAFSAMQNEIHTQRKIFAHIYTSNEQLNQWIARSQADLISLLARTGAGQYPYAGVPWYNTAFGRDGIITAMETLWTAPAIAKDVLLFLAQNQATETDTFQNAEPGKILHEMRGGEMVETKEVPFKKYYGTIDATPLFISLAGLYYKRTADKETVEKLWPHIQKAIEWMDIYGDRDGDGFIEYKASDENGLVNQGWKDSHDSVSHIDGILAEPPIALCEVQGYAYDAKMQASVLARLMGKKEYADTLKQQAETLKKKFNLAFWDEELGTYVLALDAEKKPCRIKTSNAGHCLFSGIADPSLAAKVVETMMRDDMFSGWGIRTLSTGEKRFNPMSYHNGSVWPHDVAMIASGFARYGFRKEAMQLTAALFDASLFIDLQRLPELFCGFSRRKGEGPTDYPVACSPQAWSVGAVYMLLESCLHMEIDATEKKLKFIKPFLPDFMDNILIEGLQLGNEYVSIHIHHYKHHLAMDVHNETADWQVQFIK